MRLHSRVKRGLAVTVLAMAGVGMAASPAFAVPPSNDDPTSPEPLPLGVTIPGDTTEATAEGYLPGNSCSVGYGGDGGNTVWYLLSLPADTNVTLTLESVTDQALAVYDSALVEIGCRDETFGGEVLTMPLTAGDYFVAVARYDVGSEGPFQLTATADENPPPTDGPLVFSSLLDFGPVPMGAMSSEQFLVVDNPTDSNVEFAGAYRNGYFQEFPIPYGDCPINEQQTAQYVPAGGSCSFAIQFQPSTPGPIEEIVDWTYTSGDQQYAESTHLVGEGVDEEPPPEVPEAPMAILLPGSTLLLGGAILAIRRRNNKTVPTLEV